MKSLFLEGLISARDLVKAKGLDALDALIEEHLSYTIETTAVNPQVEIRKAYETRIIDATTYGTLSAGETR